ncbi:MAG: GHKL domain-containing protein [Deltaproteobacteria bacterium]|nr:GHKL domain-containing protein [Deltaproteobacteria bacterium]
MKKFRFLILLLAVIGIGLLHFITPGHMVFYHGTYRRLSYFPIALGAIWFGVRGGLGVAAITSVAFIPHLLLFIGKDPETYLSELTEIVLYLAAGGFIGIIAGRESKLREKYKLLSEKLKKSYTRLQEETELLIEVEEQLRVSQKLADLGQLSASLAHEIKNPLGSIKGTAEILLDDFPKDHPKREFVEILLKETSRLDSSVNEVLHPFRGRKIAGQDADVEPLAQVITRVKTLLESELRKKSVGFSIKGIELVNDFLVAGERISQIFINIILNAVEAVEHSGKIELMLRKDLEGVYIQIGDNGPGVPPRDQEKIFGAFFTKRDEGTGLGLSISRKIAESYGGCISLINSGSGACFEVFLPFELSNGYKEQIGSEPDQSDQQGQPD